MFWEATERAIYLRPIGHGQDQVTGLAHGPETYVLIFNCSQEMASSLGS